MFVGLRGRGSCSSAHATFLFNFYIGGHVSLLALEICAPAYAAGAASAGMDSKPYCVELVDGIAATRVRDHRRPSAIRVAARSGAKEDARRSLREE